MKTEAILFHSYLLLGGKHQLQHCFSTRKIVVKGGDLFMKLYLKVSVMH